MKFIDYVDKEKLVQASAYRCQNFITGSVINITDLALGVFYLQGLKVFSYTFCKMSVVSFV